MKKIFFGCFLTCLTVLVFAEEQDTKTILEILKQANDAATQTQVKQADPAKAMQEMQLQKQIDMIEASKGELTEEAINTRIQKVISYYQEKIAQTKKEVTIKSYGYLQECTVNNVCNTSAFVRKKDFDRALEELKQQRKDELRENLMVAKNLSSLNPLSIRKQKLESLESAIYLANNRMNNSMVNTSYQNTNSNDTNSIITLKDGEIISRFFKIKISNSSVIIQEI